MPLDNSVLAKSFNTKLTNKQHPREVKTKQILPEIKSKASKMFLPKICTSDRMPELNTHGILPKIYTKLKVSKIETLSLI